MATSKHTALVAGASGLAGGYMLAHLLEQGGWDVIAVSRRKSKIPGDYRHIAVDLFDPADYRSRLGPLTNISHLGTGLSRDEKIGRTAAFHAPRRQ
jgi:uncharacterized protein YbjT (DUF2867 family)